MRNEKERLVSSISYREGTLPDKIIYRIKEGSLNKIQQLYSNGHATKDEYEKALVAYHAYLGEIRSDQRDKAAAVNERYKYY